MKNWFFSRFSLYKLVFKISRQYTVYEIKSWHTSSSLWIVIWPIKVLLCVLCLNFFSTLHTFFSHILFITVWQVSFQNVCPPVSNTFIFREYASRLFWVLHISIHFIFILIIKIYLEVFIFGSIFLEPSFPLCCAIIFHFESFLQYLLAIWESLLHIRRPHCHGAVVAPSPSAFISDFINFLLLFRLNPR